jgi:hypothetical protein
VSIEDIALLRNVRVSLGWVLLGGLGEPLPNRSGGPYVAHPNRHLGRDEGGAGRGRILTEIMSGSAGNVTHPIMSRPRRAAGLRLGPGVRG